YVYFIFPSRGLELAFALSIYFKCVKHGIDCVLELAKPVDLDRIPAEIVNAAKQWAERKLHRKYYKLWELQF
ncbi:MAG: hypothetical protein DRO12_04060, partial [Thermoprotei archaeon]